MNNITDLSTEKDTRQRAATSNHHARWMTDIYNDIKHLKMHELTLPGAHNAGVDQKGASGVQERWVACQLDSFSWQLEKGIRAFDLRMLDTSKNNSTPPFLFFHGPQGQHANRTLFYLAVCTQVFLKHNPNEIVIWHVQKNEVSSQEGKFDFDEAKRQLFDSFTPSLRDNLIPPAAADLTLEQIRQRYPGKNLIVAWDDGNERDDFWRDILVKWHGVTLGGTTELESYLKDVMRNPPNHRLWSMSATTFAWTGVGRIGAHLDRWYGPDAEWAKQSNIINVDFFHESNIVDNCIAANRNKKKR